MSRSLVFCLGFNVLFRSEARLESGTKETVSTYGKTILEDDATADFTIRCPTKEFRVHKAILCARSPFFSHLVARRLVAQAAERQERGASLPSLPQPLKIVLDESVIPQKYARVLVRALYVDTIDFDLVDEKNVEISDR